jgi:hypothetical protein
MTVVLVVVVDSLSAYGVENNTFLSHCIEQSQYLGVITILMAPFQCRKYHLHYYFFLTEIGGALASPCATPSMKKIILLEQ